MDNDASAAMSAARLGCACALAASAGAVVCCLLGAGSSSGGNDRDWKRGAARRMGRPSGSKALSPRRAGGKQTPEPKKATHANETVKPSGEQTRQRAQRKKKKQQQEVYSGGSERICSARTNASQDIEALVAQCAKSGQAWKDPTFGHDAFPGPSIGYNIELRDGERGKLLEIGSDGVSWNGPSAFCACKRPLGKRADGLPTWLYSDSDGDGVVTAAESMSATDVVQGSVGDCYFISALSAMVDHHPVLCDDLIDETYEASGIYGVSFWHQERWVMVWVDAYMPCYRPARASHSGKVKLIFGGSQDCKEIWPLIVEKAFAKLHGSYCLSVSSVVTLMRVCSRECLWGFPYEYAQ